jgi:hypothetical protein
MDASQIFQITDAFRPGSRRAVVTLAAGALFAILSPGEHEAAARKRNRKRKKNQRDEKSEPAPNQCAGKNWCLDRAQTCGPAEGYGKCLVEATGGNICAEILFQVPSCAECEPPNCTDCLCVLAAGGGDRCNNGANGYDYICARAA